MSGLRIEERRRRDLERIRQQGLAKRVAAEGRGGGGEVKKERQVLRRADLVARVREVREGMSVPLWVRTADDAARFMRELFEREGTPAPHPLPADDSLALDYEFLSQLEDVKVGLAPDLFAFIKPRTATAADESDACPICISNYEPSERMLCLPCSHEYHDECISAWLSDHKTCPCCKQEITEEVLLAQFQ
eukprot:TRINITY_DN2588_c0_g1_i1.p1 TRINITY_DN2588_c0_g1~~TRINITY_DN2588_c0_g1_i1.p1  ORF type:complete len:191 (+),score=31.87 TRINITY_DN2588_c0_g1_i1:44-616(+)